MQQNSNIGLPLIREWHGVDRQQFEAEVLPLKRPALLKGAMDDWPAVARARESSMAVSGYINDFGPRQIVQAFFAKPEVQGRFFYSDDMRGFNFERRELPLAELLQTLHDIEEHSAPPAIYAGAIQLKDELAALRTDNPNRLLDPSVEQLASIWIGNRGRTATHWDLPQNVACVVAGRRRFTLFPPDQLANLYIGPLDFTLAGQPVSLVDLNNPDFDKFPLFSEALKHGMGAELAPGDALYIPSMWFHNVESLDPFGVLINFWWRDGPAHMYAPLYTLLHAVLSIRDLPEDERECWRRMFDHYIFEKNGEPMPHVPMTARGFFGELTPEKIARLKAALIQGLGGQPRR